MEQHDRRRCSHASGCPNLARRRGLCDSHRTATAEVAGQVHLDREQLKATLELAALRTKYKQALTTIDQKDAALRSLDVLGQGVESFKIVPRKGSGTSEATPVLVASDWHVEELVGAEVGGLNRYSPEIAAARATEFFQASLRLLKLLNRDVKITNAVLALLGDFITGAIHGAENAEKNDLLPNHAIVHAQNLIISGIEFLLEHTDYHWVIPCHSGNHARTTHTTRFGAENGHSLEYLMYLHLAAYFRTEKRVTFIIPEGMHSYIDVYDQTIRFQHGHAIKYGGGVGGLYIPVAKALSQWDRGRRSDLDVFGHFHQFVDGGRFICNGSMIGYNAFALSIKAAFEPPRQTLFLMDRRRGRTCVWPVMFSR